MLRITVRWEELGARRQRGCPECSNSQDVLDMQAVAAGHLSCLLFDGKESRIAIGEKYGSMEQVLLDPGVLVIQMNWVKKP